jgi:hypothetical protein
MAGLIIGANGAIQEQRRDSAERQLSVVGERLANEITGVDRLVYISSESTITLRTTHPRRVAGSRYTIELKSGGQPCKQEQCIVLTATSPSITVTVPFTTEVSVEQTEIRGGPVLVRYNDSARNITISEQ